MTDWLQREITNWEQKIDTMSHDDLKLMWRHAPREHPVFDRSLPLYKRFMKRLDGLGGVV